MMTVDYEKMQQEEKEKKFAPLRNRILSLCYDYACWGITSAFYCKGLAMRGSICMKQGVYLNKLYMAELQLHKADDENPSIWAAAADADAAAAAAARPPPTRLSACGNKQSW